MGQFHVILVMPSYGLIPVPPHLRHLTILSPFLRVPFSFAIFTLLLLLPSVLPHGVLQSRSLEFTAERRLLGLRHV